MLLLPIKTEAFATTDWFSSRLYFVRRKSSPNDSNVQQFVTDVKHYLFVKKLIHVGIITQIDQSWCLASPLITKAV